jgi:UDP-2,3-diacylglucosamine hydrolase
MTTYFISDLHLQEEAPEISTIFFNFLKNEATNADALYILGDLFEVWVGDDDSRPLAKQVKKALLELSKKVPIYMITGNRDFALGERFAHEAGVKILDDPTVIDLYGKKVLLSHGDIFCIDDVSYQNFRKKVRNPNFLRNMARLPLWVRRGLARYARYKSKRHTGRTELSIQDVSQQEVEKHMQNHHVDLLIHGHTHRPAIHAKRIVLGAWHDHGSVLEYKNNHEVALTTL